MSFDCAFYAYPKYKDFNKYDDYFNVEQVFEFENNPWYREHGIDTLDKFCEAYGYVKPNSKDVEHFKHLSSNNKMSKIEFGSFCSNTAFFYELVKEECGNTKNQDSWKLDREDVVKCLDKTFKNFTDMFKIEPVSVDHSFKCDEDSITLNKCDGVEFTYENGMINRVYTSIDERGTQLGMIEDYSMWEYNGYVSIIETLIKCLSIDFYNYNLFYIAGYLMKFDENKNLIECTEKELYDLWFDARKTLKVSYDDYLVQAINSGVNITERFIIISDEEH